MSYVPTWKIFARAPIAYVVMHNDCVGAILTHLWIRNGAFGRAHDGCNIPRMG